MVTSEYSFRSKSPLTREDYEVIRQSFPGVFKDVDEFMKFVAEQQDKADNPPYAKGGEPAADPAKLRHVLPEYKPRRPPMVYGGGRA